MLDARSRRLLGLGSCLVGAIVVVASAWLTARPAAAAHRLHRGLPRPTAFLSLGVRPAPPLPTGRQLHQHAGGSFYLYPPWPRADSKTPRTVSDTPRASIVMMLHGMCSDALATCDYWNRAGREGSFLLCPVGNGRCGEWPDWRGSSEEKAQFLDGVLAATASSYGQHLAPPGGDILIGFSRGAFVARDVAYARPGRYRGLILIGAALKPDPQRLRASGIRRVVLAAGDYDCARPTMQLAAARLNAAGLPSRYVSTGKIWHQLPADLEAILRDAIAWIRAEPE